MPKDLDLDIKNILGELSEVNSKNEQKVVAVASWNNRPDTIDIRRYNVMDDILTKGISLTPEEAVELVYILLSNPIEIKYDRERVYQILKEQEEAEVDVEQLVQVMQGGDDEVEENDSESAEGVTEDEQAETVVYGNWRVVPKKSGLFHKKGPTFNYKR